MACASDIAWLEGEWEDPLPPLKFRVPMIYIVDIYTVTPGAGNAGGPQRTTLRFLLFNTCIELVGLI